MSRTKKGPELKSKIRLEYELKSSPKILFSYLSSPNGLAQWFANDVVYKDGTYHFIWDDETQRAKMVINKDNRIVRFKWDDEDPNSYLEFEILQDELTNDVALAVTDFAIESDKEDKILIWNNQVEDLIHVLGA
jgi:uncharacterized protein YndB with AHSA1/START domain